VLRLEAIGMTAAATIPPIRFSVSLLLASVPSVTNSIFQDKTIAEPDAACGNWKLHSLTLAATKTTENRTLLA
jgi:hypothetical protein